MVTQSDLYKSSDDDALLYVVGAYLVLVLLFMITFLSYVVIYSSIYFLIGLLYRTNIHVRDKWLFISRWSIGFLVVLISFVVSITYFTDILIDNENKWNETSCLINNITIAATDSSYVFSKKYNFRANVTYNTTEGILIDTIAKSESKNGDPPDEDVSFLIGVITDCAYEIRNITHAVFRKPDTKLFVIEMYLILTLTYSCTMCCLSICFQEDYNQYITNQNRNQENRNDENETILSQFTPARKDSIEEVHMFL